MLSNLLLIGVSTFNIQLFKEHKNNFILDRASNESVIAKYIILRQQTKNIKNQLAHLQNMEVLVPDGTRCLA